VSCIKKYLTFIYALLSKYDTKSFSGNDYIDKIKIITKNGGVSIGSSRLTKTLIDVFLSKNIVKRKKMGYFDKSA